MYIYELALVDHWSDQIARWFIESKIEPNMMHELIDKYSDHIREVSNNGAFLCVTLIQAQAMPSLTEIINCIE